MMIQPFLPSDRDGGRIFAHAVRRRFSHAIVKRPKAGDFRVQPHSAAARSPAHRRRAVELAQAALAAAPAEAPMPASTSCAAATANCGSWNWS